MSGEFGKNRDDCAYFLGRFANETLGHFIGGEPVAGTSGETFDNLSPVDGASLGRVAAGSAEEVGQAGAAAEAAFRDWRRASGKVRRKILHAIADGITARAREIALVESADTGQPIRFMSKAAARGADNFRFFADRAAEAADGLALPAEEHLNYTMRQPIGPVGVITPWNTPFMLATWKIAPALAAGCTVVHKPAEWTPLSAAILTEICHDAGLPPGVLNRVNGTGETAGRALTEHAAIRAVAFVGETVTGSRIMRQGADTLKRVHFELGGKNPVIVFDDADLERALDAVVFMIYSLNGERCTSSSRLLVQESIEERFVAALTERIGRLAVGHPLDPATDIGPLVHPRHVEKVTGYFARACDAGARIAAGGAAAAGGGNYVQPTLFTGARNDMAIAQEEIFGPVLTAMTFADEAEAVRLANDVRYGLAAYVWTSDIGRGHRLARELDAGMVWINSENNRHLPAPFGGMKASGVGRDGGDYSFDFYMETKNVCVALGTHRVPVLGGE
ncbi:MAG TPA: 5-carboxymethyl-2-hydroxymuconate semialdehyde dehydrogenase [Woeseiaceae bacterium]|nr:5-carboxymethyl-2-hydroxymuconate semialdehyde dehydrogenase [Woeseiaceae bacterium]